jgi:hypothetical protein
MTSYRLMDGVSGRPGVGSSGTQPPASGFAFSGGNPEFGCHFKVTSGAWLEGYWWWCAASTQDTGAVKFILWQNNSNGNAQTGNFPVTVPGSAVTSGTLTAGAWNYTALPSPLALTPGTPYCAAVCYAASAGFPRTTDQFGAAEPYAAGITNGPLFAFPSGSALAWSMPQQSYAFPGTADPASGMPTNNNQDNLFWIDIQVTDTPPPGATYRAFPNLPQSANGQAGSGVYTVATQFRLSQACSVAKLWHYSPAGSSQLPTECGVWRESDQTLAAGTHLSAPSWKNSSGAAANPGDGWIYAVYTGVTLPAGNYRVSSFCANGGAGGGAGNLWFSYSYGYWSTDFAQNFGQGGVTTGPLYVPDNASASAPGQSLYDQSGVFAYPATYNAGQDSENHWVDLEVTPVAPGSGLLAAASII